MDVYGTNFEIYQIKINNNGMINLLLLSYLSKVNGYEIDNIRNTCPQ